MMEAGILLEGDRIELLDGEIVEMTPIGPRHVSCVARLHRLLLQALSDGAFISSQGVVRLDRFSEPQPDVIVLRPRDDDYATGHPAPEETLLVVEVADSSLRFDRGIKLPLYAAAGVPEVWIVDLEHDRVEIHRSPEDGAFTDSVTVTVGPVWLSEIPEVELEIREILPPRA